jgi:multiubiquitin
MTVQPSEHHQKPPEPRPTTIRVNNKPVELPDRNTTGAAIKAAAGIPADFKLYGPNGAEIADDDDLKVHNNERFTAISGQDVS